MVRVRDLDASLKFYCDLLGLEEVSRSESAQGRFTLVFLCAPGDTELARERRAPMVELTYNWDAEDYQGGHACPSSHVHRTSSRQKFVERPRVRRVLHRLRRGPGRPVA